MLETLFSPKSIAVIGASRNKGKLGYAVLANIIDWFMGDQIPPSMVTNVMTTLEEDLLHLNWLPASDNKGVDYYVIFRNTQPDFVPVGSDSVGSTADTFFVDIDSAVGATLMNHYYSVKAVDGAGNKSVASGLAGEFDRHLITMPPDSLRAR